MRRVCQLQIVSTEGSLHRGVPLVGHLLRCGPISSSVVFTVLQVELALVEDAVASCADLLPKRGHMCEPFRNRGCDEVSSITDFRYQWIEAGNASKCRCEKS
jgi:hypothetical protein